MHEHKRTGTKVPPPWGSQSQPKPQQTRDKYKKAGLYMDSSDDEGHEGGQGAGSEGEGMWSLYQ